MEIAGLFPRTKVQHSPEVEVENRKPLICSATLSIKFKQRVYKELYSTSERLYKHCKRAPHPKTIHTKIIGSRRLTEPNSFFGNDMVTWLVDNKWSSSRDIAVFLCSEILFKNKIIVPVYPFIKRFVCDTVLYKFIWDDKESKETTPRRENNFKIAKEICLRRMQELQKRNSAGSTPTRRSIGGDSDPLSQSSSSLSDISNRFRGRKSSSGSSTPTDTSGVYIAGNMLLSMIDRSCDGQLASQLMLRYGYIYPAISDSITAKDMSHKQVFYGQEKYKFSEEVVRAVSRLANFGSAARSRKQSVMLEAVNRRLSQEMIDQNFHRVQTKAVTLERPTVILDKPCYHTMQPRNSLPGSEPIVFDARSLTRNQADRRYSMINVSRPKSSFFDKLRKTSK